MALITALDDDPVILEMIGLIFSQTDHGVVTYDNHTEFFKYARARVPDLILLDLLMPEVSGWEVLKRIRLDPVLRRVPVIILSSSSGVANRVKGLSSGAYDYLEKPFNADELLLRAGLILERQEQQGTDCQGKLEVFPFSELINSLEQSRGSGNLMVESDGKSGEIQFSKGRIVSARYGKLEGVLAMESMIGLKQGSFKYIQDSDPKPFKDQIALPKTQSILIDACWVEDELEKRKDLLPIGDAPLVISTPPRSGGEFDDLPLMDVFCLLEKKTYSLDGLVNLELSSASRVRLAVALLSEMGAVAAHDA